MDSLKETNLLYEIDKSCGLIGLTIDGNCPVYILFQHSIKVELTLKVNSKVNDGRGLEVMQSQVPGIFRETRRVRSKPMKTASGSFHIDSPLNQALNFQDIEKLIKDKLVVIKEQKLEQAISRVKRKAVKTVVENKVTSAIRTVDENKVTSDQAADVKQNHETLKQVTIKQEFSDDSPSVSDAFPAVSDRLPDKAESDYDMSEEEQIVASTESEGQGQVIDCEYCFQSFGTRLEFFNHRRSKTISHQCKYCSKVFSFQAYLLAHIRKHHPTDGHRVTLLDTCDVCGLKLKNFNRLKNHMLIHTGEYHYNCCVCGKNIAGFGALNIHMASHKKAGMVKCTCCDQYFTSRSELSKHQLALLEIKCHLCGEVLPNRTSRTVHYQLVHPDSILTCNVCQRLFSSDAELSSHMVYHKRYKKKQCTVCGKFVSRLERHILTHKSMKDVDESELFMCDKCPMKFKMKASLQRHQRTHSQERPFKCSQCPKSFAHQGVLLKHIKTHSSILPYACEVCGKRCKEKSNLTVHMRVHSSSKPFQCQLCTQAFSYKSSLDGHMRSKHSSTTPVLSESSVELSNKFLLSEKETTDYSTLSDYETSFTN